MKVKFPRTTLNQYASLLYQEGLTTGNVYWVDSTNAAASNQTGNGYSPDAPFATAAYAAGVASADNGDIILLAPGHAESLTTAGAITMAIAGVTIRGLGVGRQRARFTFSSSTAATLAVTAARCAIENVVFINGIDAQVTMLSVSAADFVLRNCEWQLADGTTQALNGLLTTAAADRLRVKDCHFHGGATAGAVSAISLVGGDSIVIEDCVFFGAFDASGGVLKNATTDSTGLLVEDCHFQNSTASNTKSIVVTASTTGKITGCTFQILSGSSPVTAAGMSVIANTTASALASDPGLEHPTLGRKVVRTAADVFDGTQKSLFTVSTGKVLLTGFYLEVSGAAVDASASNLKVRSNPTIGTDADLSANLDVNADELGSIYSLTGNPSDAITGGSGGGAATMDRPFILDVGTLDIVTSADVGTGGALVAATLWYIPLEDGASVAAA